MRISRYRIDGGPGQPNPSSAWWIGLENMARWCKKSETKKYKTGVCAKIYDFKPKYEKSRLRLFEILHPIKILEFELNFVSRYINEGTFTCVTGN
jgi:hypothetical protein